MKPKKIIKLSELKKMSLNEHEYFWMESAVNSINKIRTYGCESTAFFAYGTSIPAKRSAYRKALIYFAKKFIAETGSNCLDEISAKIATSIFFCSCIQIEVYLMGIAAEPDSEIIVNNRFGLNYIDIK